MGNREERPTSFRLLRFAGHHQDLLASAQIFRGAVYVEKGYLSSSDLTGGRDVDIDDQRAHHVGIWLTSGQLIGYARLIPDDGQRPLPVGLPPFAVAGGIGPRSAEVSRLAVDKRFRRSGIDQVLWREIYRLCLTLCVDNIWAIVERGLFDQFLRFGLPFEVMGAAELVDGAWSYPVCCRTQEVLESLCRVDLAFACFFARHEEDQPFQLRDLIPSPDEISLFARSARSETGTAT